MDNFNEEEIQRKIEEKRKRFIENAHRALGFYDQNILTTTDEHKKKRHDMLEQEFNKVFDDKGKPLRRYDEEPAKPLILAASKNPENINTSPAEEKSNKPIGDDKVAYIERRPVEEDSLTAAEKEQDLRKQASLTTKESSSKISHQNSASPMISKSKALEKEATFEEEKKNVYSYDESFKSSKRNTESSLPITNSKYSDDELSEDEYEQSKNYKSKVVSVAKNKKMKKFVVNTRH